MKTLILALLFLPFLASATSYFSGAPITKPCLECQPKVGTVLTNLGFQTQTKTEAELYKELYIALLKLKVELLRLQIKEKGV